MSQTELERRVTDVLNRHAEEAMSRTNTEEQLVELLDNTRAEGTRRRRWAVAGLVALAAAVALAFWVANRGTDRAQPQPAGPLSPERVATEYLRAAAAFDLNRAESFFSGDTHLEDWGGIDGWRSTQLWNQAVLFQMQPDTCTSRSAVRGTATVECPYAFTGLGSHELGLRPYRGSSYVFTVRDGAIVTIADNFEFNANDYSVEVWEPFAAWVKDNYPQDFAVMYADRGSSYVTTAESIALWHQHLFAYVADKLAEQDGSQAG